MLEPMTTALNHPALRLGDCIRRARENAGFHQDVLADLIGVSRPLISKWERSRSEPTVSQLRKIAEATGEEWLLDLRMLPAGWRDVSAGQAA